MANPIIALATPPLKGALALIRLSGDGVFEMTDRLFSKRVSRTSSRTIYYGTLSDHDVAIDEVVLLAYPAPHTMTGEDVVEISCHGSMVIVEQIVQAYLSLGARYATAGEFTSRAFYSGKVDLIEAEAINDLINATTVESKNLALLSLSGKTSDLVVPLQKEIADLLSLLEVNIDYPEYQDIETLNEATVASKCRAIKARIASLIESGSQGAIIRNGVSIALIGRPNVGKSSLLNALLSKEKAIVSPIPGTTRDVVEGELSIHGIPVRVLDTAGIRDSEDVVEQLGVERSKKAIEEADLVLVVRDASSSITEEDEAILRSAEAKKAILVYNKADLITRKEGVLYASAAKGDVEAVKEAIYQSLHLEESSFLTPSLSSARELGILRKIDEELTQAIFDAESEAPVDLLSVSLHSAYNLTRILLGQDPTQDLTEEIFSRFCVGK